MNAKILFNWIKWGLAALAVATLSFTSIHSTGTTEVGVRTIKWSLFHPSGVENKVYQPGATYFFLPIFNEWEIFDARLQIVEMTASVDKGDKHGVDDLPFKTKDGNDIRIDVIFSYRVDPQRTPYIRQFVAKDMVELKEKYTIVLVTNNVKQAARVGDKTAFFLGGELIELDKTDKLFTAPHDARTDGYIRGKYG